MPNYKLAEEHIKSQGERVFEFGDKEHGSPDDWIEQTESDLGFKLPPSYIWFLKNYGGGEVYGDEICSIYSKEYDDIPGGDIRFNYRNDLKQGFSEPNQLFFFSTDFGERFFLDLDNADGNGEYPVKLMRGKHFEDYAPSFVDWLLKFTADGDSAQADLSGPPTD